MWANSSGRSPKISNVSKSLRLLTKREQCEWIAQVAHQKWVTMNNSLRSLRGNERSWANRSGRSPKMIKWVNRLFFWANRSFAHFWAKNERFARKTDDRMPTPVKSPPPLETPRLGFIFPDWSTRLFLRFYRINNILTQPWCLIRDRCG